MTATAEPKKMTERERFGLFTADNPEFAALLATAESTRDGTVYGAMADWLDEHGEMEWASYFRTCCRGEEYGLTIDGSTYHTLPASGYQGRTVYDVVRMSPRMRNRFGQSEYLRSAAELVSYFTVVRQRANAKDDRKAKEKVAKDEARRQPNPFAVGDLLHYSYGYNCTRNVFAQVIGVKGRTVTIRRIACRQVGDGQWNSYRVGPCPGRFVTDELETLTLTVWAYGDSAGVRLPVKGGDGKSWQKVSAEFTFCETED